MKPSSTKRCDECGKRFPLDELQQCYVENHDGDPDMEPDPKWVIDYYCKSCFEKMSFSEEDIAEMMARDDIRMKDWSGPR